MPFLISGAYATSTVLWCLSVVGANNLHRDLPDLLTRDSAFILGRD